MNQKERNELRRRFTPERTGISRICGCYVNGGKEVITSFDTSLGRMTEEEQETYLNLLKKCLSGELGKNLLDLEFTTEQVRSSPEHRLLQTLRTTALQDEEDRMALYRKIMDVLDLDGGNYLILLGAESYDVPFKSRDDEVQADASDGVYRYFICCVCPVKGGTSALRFDKEEKAFHLSGTGSTVGMPEFGFLFPAFDDRAANIYNALFYVRKPAEIYGEVIHSVFQVEPPMSAQEQREIFDTALRDALEQDCSYDVIQSVQEQILERLEEHKERKDPEPLTLRIDEIGEMLLEGGAEEARVQSFQETCQREYGGDIPLTANNLVEKKKCEVCTPEVKITVAPEHGYLIETRIIEGRKYLLIPADDGVEINGIPVTVSEKG